MTPFAGTLHAEWTKLAALRSTRLALAASVVVSVGLAALLVIVTGETWHSWSAADRASFRPLDAVLLAGLPVAVIFAALAAKVATAEYGTGMIDRTFAVTPRRGRVLAAKTGVVVALTLVAGIALNVLTAVVATAIAAVYGLPTISATGTTTLRALVVGGALSPVFPLVALALGVLTRSTAGAIVGTIAVIVGPAFVGASLPEWWALHVQPYVPADAADAITTGHVDGAARTLPVWLALPVVLAWLALFGSAARAALLRRDAS